MTEYENRESNFFKGFVFGSILGVLAGIFFAPKSGQKWMSEIKEKGSKALKDAEEIYEEATAVIDDVQHHAEDLKKDLLKMRQKAKEILGRGGE